jgi:hypothetical protein
MTSKDDKKFDELCKLKYLDQAIVRISRSVILFTKKENKRPLTRKTHSFDKKWFCNGFFAELEQANKLEDLWNCKARKERKKKKRKI